MNKYKLKLEPYNNLYRIIALCDIPARDVETDDKGGLVEGEHNLSQEDDCWIEYNVSINKSAYVEGNAHVGGNVIITDNAIIRDSAVVWGYEHTQTVIKGKAIIDSTTRLSGGTWETTPKVIKGSIYDVFYNDEQIAIGCECHSLEWWEKHGLWAAQRGHFTATEIEEYREHLNAIRKEYADDKEV